MSFDIDVRRRLGELELEVAFATGSGITALFGPSGSGKTSLLSMVAGLIRPESGHIVVAGETLFANGIIDCPPEERRAGYIFQDTRLFPHLRVRTNLRYGKRGEGPIGFDDAVSLLGLGTLLDRWPRTLSGGETQRVAIGRALLSNPRFLLMDEPLASLDRSRAEEVMGMIERVRDAAGLPILYVSHNPEEVARLAAHVVEVRR